MYYSGKGIFTMGAETLFLRGSESSNGQGLRIISHPRLPSWTNDGGQA